VYPVPPAQALLAEGRSSASTWKSRLNQFRLKGASTGSTGSLASSLTGSCLQPGNPGGQSTCSPDGGAGSDVESSPAAEGGAAAAAALTAASSFSSSGVDRS
jgi:hypothetical protein